MKSILAVFMTIVLCLSSFGCGSGTTSSLITTLNAVADAASVSVIVADGFLATGKLSQADVALVNTYATAVGTAANQSVAELRTTETNVQKITKITAYFAAVVPPNVSAGGVLIGPAIQAVVVAINLFINQLHSNVVLTAAKAAPHAPIKLSGADKTVIKSMQKKIAETAARAKK